jgi:hypothetical protein
MSKRIPPDEEVFVLLEKFMESQKSEYKLVSLGVFGSVARGEARDDSDVDIVFETTEPNLFRTSRMKQDLEQLLSRPVDIVRLRERMNPRLKQRILQEARFV